MAMGLLAGFIVSLGLGFFIRKKISALVKLLKVTNDCLDKMRGESLIAVFMFFVLVTYYVASAEIFLFLLSSGTHVADSTNPIFTKYTRNALDYALIAYFVFGFMVINNFIHNFFYMVYCILCSLWYYNNKNPRRFITSPISHAFY